jgi:hypothetical protein
MPMLKEQKMDDQTLGDRQAVPYETAFPESSHQASTPVTNTVFQKTTLSGTFVRVDFRSVDLTDTTLNGKFYNCDFRLPRRTE